MVAFLSENPALSGMQQAYDMQAQQQQSEMARLEYDEAVRTRDSNEAVDTALRNWIQRSYPAGSAPGVAQTGPQGASLAGQQPNVTTAAAPGSAAGPGPAATAGQGNAPGFDAMMQQVAPRMPQSGVQQVQPIGRAGPAPEMRNLPGVMGGPQLQAMPAQQGGASLSGQQPMEPPRLNRVDLARDLANTPGTGASAIALIEQQEAIDAEADKAKDHAVENFFKSLDAGDVNSAQYWAQKSGMDLPPDALADAELVKHLGVVGKWKQLYGADLTGFGKFTQQYFNAMESGQKVNPYSFFAANPPSSRGAARASTKQADFNFLVEQGLSKSEAMQRVWSGGAASGMKWSDALKIAQDVVTTKIEGLPYAERKAAQRNFDVDVEALARKYMGGDFSTADEGEAEGEGYIDESSGREVYQDENGAWLYADDDSPYVGPE
jgi:hypothetical protein